MKQFFMENEKLSMGRLITFIAAMNALIVFTVKVFLSEGDIGENTANACIWMLSAAILGKGVQKIGESLKKD